MLVLVVVPLVEVVGLVVTVGVVVARVVGPVVMPVVVDDLPTVVEVVVVVAPPPTVEPLQLPTGTKLAHVMRVVLAKCRTMLRLPKKAPIPCLVEAKSSVKVAAKLRTAPPVVELTWPCLPERSPTWHVSGREASQGVSSPRW